MQPTLADRNNNPGNLKDLTTGQFKQFASPQEGYAALLNDLETKKTGQSRTGLKPEQTLADFAKVYAPASDKNDPAQYTANLANHMGVRPDAQLKDLDTGAWAEAIAKAEGYTPAKDLPARQQNFSQTQKPIKPLEIPKPEEPTLGQELGQRGSDIANAITDVTTGKQNIISGVLQTAGGLTGGLSDVINKVIEKTPIVGTVFKGIENVIGEGAKSFFNTDVGKNVAKSISNFSEEHPELSKDIGASINIATSIPILKGIGMIKNVALDATSSALKGYAEKAMSKDLIEIASRNIGGKNLLSRSPDVIENLIKERALPDIINGKLSTKEARIKIGQTISEIENNELQPALKKATSQGISTSYSPLSDIEKKAILEAENQLKPTGPISEYFSKIRTKYGEYPNISQLNEAKRKVAKNITEAGFTSPTITTDKIVRGSLQTAVEEGANALGLPDVALINKKMADLFKVQDLLKVIENKPIKSGFTSGIVKNAATVGGEALGNVTGIPFAGALVGRGIGSNVGKKLTGGIPGILNRTGKGAVRVSKKEMKNKLGGLLGGAVTQKMSNQ